MARYWPKHRTQLGTNSPTAPWDCLAYSFAMWADAVTIGAISLTGAQVRSRTNEPRPDPGSPGLNLGQIETVAKNLALAIYHEPASSPAGLFARARTFAPILLPVIYGKVDLELRGDRNYLGPHGVLLYGVHDDRAHYKVWDPLQKVYRWWGVAMTSRAWTAYGRSFAFGRVPPLVSG